MGAPQFDVVVIGGGCAGLSAAVGLARAGFSVVVLEAAPFPGAENWSGCVYFGENLVHPSLLGPNGLEGLAWERRLVERGFFISNGHGLLGFRYRDPNAFRHCVTVLRPAFDHHLAQLAASAGATVLSSTTVESLIRDGDRVIGVATQRGPVYGSLTFLAEGDASHLVSRESLERSDVRQPPSFLQGIKQVIDLPPGAVEANFGLKGDEGAAYEIVLRNGTLKGKPVHLNMGGFLYTNRQSLSIGLVLPLEHIGQHFEGDPNLLMEWFESLPDVRRWCHGGKRGVFGAKLIRGGGARDIPHLVGDGLVVGGAATAIGVDFPYPNYTGPATRMGLLLVEAAKAIRSAGGAYSESDLRQHYLLPLQKTRAWQDVEFLRRWPTYVERTQVFFGSQIDLALGAAYVWTRPWSWRRSRWLECTRLFLEHLGPSRWSVLRDDFRMLRKALRLKVVLGRPALGRFLLSGWLNAIRDLLGQPRAGLPAAGELVLLHHVGGDARAAGRPPWLVRRWLARFTPVLAAAACRVYENDEEPLESKLRGATQLLLDQVNILDVLAAMAAGAMAALTAVGMLGYRWLRRALTGNDSDPAGVLNREYRQAAERVLDLTPHLAGAAAAWEGRLGTLSYQPPGQSHIHVHWPRDLAQRAAIVKDGLWHVCPAHVYEARPGPSGQVQIVVNYENCIKCESCWRATDAVDWGRDGAHRFVYAVSTPALKRLGEAAEPAAQARLIVPKSANAGGTTPLAPAESDLITRLDRQVSALATALAEEPRTIDRDRTADLIEVATYAEQMAHQLQGLLEGGKGQAERADAHRLCLEIVARLGKMVQLVREGRYAWAAGEGRQVRQHHLAKLRNLAAPATASAPTSTEHDPSPEIAIRLEEAFPSTAWRQLEPMGTRHEGPPPRLTPAQDQLLLNLAAKAYSTPSNGSWAQLSSYRKVLLRELARRDASLAYRVASHGWAKELAGSDGSGWHAFGIVGNGRIVNGKCHGTAWFIPAADTTVLLIEDRLVRLTGATSMVRREWLAPLGLRGAGLQRIVLDGWNLPGDARQVDPEELRRRWQASSAADLISMARGMAEILVARAVSHAGTRVQFPGLFADDEARDSIAKFGAVKKLLAQMAVRQQLLTVLDERLRSIPCTTDGIRQTSLLKALAAEALGTSPGSLAYNAGQVFGGTGFSEDDLLAKFYRDAAAWRYLGPSNPQVWQDQGDHVLKSGALSQWPDEAELFDQMAQRKALLPELDQLRVWRTRLKALLGDCSTTQLAVGHGADLLESIGRVDGAMLGAKAMLLHLHARLERVDPAQTERALVRCWFDELHSRIDELEQKPLPRRAALTPRTTPEAPGSREYDLFLATPLPYETGDFLVQPIDLTTPRFVPEMVRCDAGLNSLDVKYRNLFRERFGGSREGQVFERWLEDRHRPLEADLDFLRKEGCFRFLIPTDLGGQGFRKAEYYLMVQNAQREADVAMALTIQVNASLGTTPIFLARNKDIPKAKKELAPFVADVALQSEIETRLRMLLEETAFPRLRAGVEELQKRLEGAVFSKPTVRILAHRFVEAWSALGRALREFDLTACQAALRRALEGWQHACVQAPELQDELERRREACTLYLRLISAGQISAFALTEPSAGSDTARMSTRAVPRSVPVEIDQEGVHWFLPHGSKERQVLLDARRVEVSDAGIFYRWSDKAPPGRIEFNEYDYETDDPRKKRYYWHGDRKVHFSDIAQLRYRGGMPWYDYWELNGSKMWITNGRLMGVLALYARTEEGVTGFLVDRHSQGLVVGKDERKLGQCGSPTNELSIQSLRVPRENVLGLEGRGQVNALETLNLGRAGIAMSSLASLQTVVQACGRVNADDTSSDHSGRLAQLAENQFIAEALAFELVGRLEHEQTRSLRIEASIAKFLVTELLHETIELAEDVHGLPGQTQDYVIEKRKRDARVLNIYEGTNEIQRSLIWTHLVNEVAPRMQDDAPIAANQPAELKQLLEEYANLRKEFAALLRSAVKLLGVNLVQNPSIQASGFVLAEAAAWLKAFESVLGRAAWLLRFGDPGSPTIVAALARCRREAVWRLKQFDLELGRLRQGRYSPAVRAASLLLRDSDHPPTRATPTVTAVMNKPLRILVVLEFAAGETGRPFLENGSVYEPYRALTASSQAALEVALRLRDLGGQHVSVQVAAVGPPSLSPRLREIVAQEVERGLLLLAPQALPSLDQAASALAAVLKSHGMACDLLLGPAGSERQEDGLLTSLLAAQFDLNCQVLPGSLTLIHSESESTAVLSEGDRSRPRTLPLALEVAAPLPLRQFSTEAFFAGLAKPLQLVRWPGEAPCEPVFWQAGEATQSESSDQLRQSLGAADAAEIVIGELGLSGDRADVTPIGSDRIADVASPAFLERCKVIGVVAADANGKLADSALAVVRNARLLDDDVGVCLLVPSEESAQRFAAAQVVDEGVARILLAVMPQPAVEHPAARRRWLEESLACSGLAPACIIGESWMGALWPKLQRRLKRPGVLSLRVSRADRTKSGLYAEFRLGRLRGRRHLELSDSSAHFLALARDIETSRTMAGESTPTIQRWTPRLPSLYDAKDLERLVEEVKQATGVVSLSDAEFIIDVGFGIRNRDGYDAVVPALEAALRGIGVQQLAIGGSRKVTEELHVLPMDRQIGQSGVSVNPRILLAIGISGAPQHLSYIGQRATIIAFNRDPEAPLMTLNQRQPRPRVFGVVGDLFETVPAFAAALNGAR